MKKRVAGKISGFVIFVIGIIFLVNSQINITGAFLGFEDKTSFSFIIGAVFLISGIIIFSITDLTLEEKAVSSSIKKYPPLLRLTKEAVKNQVIERELNHLIQELHKGNLEAGLGHPGHIEETKIHYLRGRNGGRLYYRRRGENSYEIVAKSAKGRNQEQVIKQLKEIY